MTRRLALLLLVAAAGCREETAGNGDGGGGAGTPVNCARPIASDWTGDYEIVRLVIRHQDSVGVRAPLKGRTLTVTSTPTKDQAGDIWVLTDTQVQMNAGGLFIAYY